MATGCLKAAAVCAALAPWSFAAAGDLPDAKLTPGVVRTDLTQEQMCAIKWGKDHRAVTASMKRQAFLNYGYKKLNKDPRCPCEIDHEISRELLGADDIKNLWPQSYRGAWNAHKKDALENRMHKLVCNGTITLKQAQQEISHDWITAYKKYLTP